MRILPDWFFNRFMVLYRAVSTAEKDDIQNHKQFRTQINTLEAKQFFCNETAVVEYIIASINAVSYHHTLIFYLYQLTISAFCT